MTQDVRQIRISDFNYDLPDSRIAKHPLARREQCRLLLYKNGQISGHTFADVPRLLPQNALLVYNNTRVINARLRFQKPGQGATIEVFCLAPSLPSDYAQIFAQRKQCQWQCLVGNSKRWKSGDLSREIVVDGSPATLTARRAGRQGDCSLVQLEWTGGATFASVIEAVGEIPIPPYLKRATEPSDSADYQTVYSHIDGSVAAPTAGLHFTDEILRECDKRGIARRELTLHVGAGTFQPVKSDTIGSHDMHTEFISVSRSLIAELAAGERPVVAVGTTSVRTLESLYYIGAALRRSPGATAEELRVGQWDPYESQPRLTTREALAGIVEWLDGRGLDSYVGSTQIMIAPSFRFRVVDGMITNFHQPQSTLLLLVSAFVDGRWRDIYDYAMAHDFRFLSYGDASLLLR